MNFYQFKKLYKKLIKEYSKDFEVNDKGQIIKINNYDSKKAVYFFNIFFENATYDCYDSCVDICSIQDCKKNFWDKCIQYGILFDTEENINKFIDYIKNYNKE